MVVSTNLSAGDDIFINMYAAPADQATAWIDLNNNGVKEAGEDITFDATAPKGNPRTAGARQTYTLGAATYTIYGKISALHFHGADCVTALDVSANPALVQLVAYDNQLTALDLSANANIRDIEIDSSPHQCYLAKRYFYKRNPKPYSYRNT